MENYLSITEFAAEHKISVQSIYKRLKKQNDPIHNYIKVKGGKKYISASAKEIYNKDVVEYAEMDKVEKPLQNNDIIELLKEQIEQQKKEIEFKNKQLEDLTEQLKASSERETNYQTLLNQQQQLTAADKQKILQLESEAEKKKKGFFSKFKRKGNKE